MTTPNIENIIKSLVVKAGVMEMGEKIAWGSDTALMRQAAAALQTQAERIAELEAEINTRASYGDEQTDFAIKLAGERDALRAELDAIAATQPVAWAISYDGVTPYTLWHEGDGPLLDCEVKRQGGTTQKMPLFTRPMPAQPIIGLQAIHDAITVDQTLAQPNIQNQIVKDISRKPCHACAHYEQGKRTGVSIYDETCYICREYYANKWEAA